MSRKDYQLIAEALRSSNIPGVHRITVARAMATALATTNPRFDRKRFLAACEGTFSGRCPNCRREGWVSDEVCLCGYNELERDRMEYSERNIQALRAWNGENPLTGDRVYEVEVSTAFNSPREWVKVEAKSISSARAAAKRGKLVGDHYEGGYYDTHHVRQL